MLDNSILAYLSLAYNTFKSINIIAIYMPKLLVSGAINWDTTIIVDEFPRAGEEVKANNVISVPGGKGGNTASAARRILDDTVGIIGVLGNDDIAKKQLDIFDKEGIDTNLILRKDIPSGQAYVIVDKKGENIILTYKAANHMIKPDDIEREDFIESIDNAKMIIVIDPPLQVADKLIDIAYRKHKRIIFMPALLTKEGLDSLSDSLKKASFIIVNEHEIQALSDEEDVIKASTDLSDRFGRIITTLGNKGCIFCYNKKVAKIPAVDLKLFDLKSISTVGAGDTFTGAFGAYLLRGFGEIESLFLASIAAALKTTKYGPRESPTYDEVKRYLNDPRMDEVYKKIKFI